MQIGTLAKRTGVSARMLRYYEEEKLLSPRRRESGYREYSAEDEETVRKIRQLSKAGLKLDFIRRFLPCVRGDRPEFDPCPDLLSAMRKEIDELDARIGELSRSRALLSRYYREMTGEDTGPRRS